MPSVQLEPSFKAAPGGLPPAADLRSVMLRGAAARKVVDALLPEETDEPLSRKPSLAEFETIQGAEKTPSASLALARADAGRSADQASLQFWSRTLAEAQDSPEEEEDDETGEDESADTPPQDGPAPAADLRMIVFGTNRSAVAGLHASTAKDNWGDGGFVVFGPGDNLFLKKPAAPRSNAPLPPLKLARPAGETRAREIKRPAIVAAPPPRREPAPQSTHIAEVGSAIASARAAEAVRRPRKPARPYWASLSTLALLAWFFANVVPSGIGLADNPLRDRFDGATPALIAQGDHDLRIGDIAAARRSYARAADAGSARAALMMGKTFDPIFLAGAGITGVPGETASALNWYRRAWALDDTSPATPLRPME
jgi:hypothetical protein